MSRQVEPDKCVICISVFDENVRITTESRRKGLLNSVAMKRIDLSICSNKFRNKQ